MNTYLAFYNGKKIEVKAETSFQAQENAARILKISEKNSYKVAVVLAEKDGETVTHSPSF